MSLSPVVERSGHRLNAKGQATRGRLLAELDRELAELAAAACGPWIPWRILRPSMLCEGCGLHARSLYYYFPNIAAALRALADDYGRTNRPVPDYLGQVLAQAESQGVGTPATSASPRSPAAKSGPAKPVTAGFDLEIAAAGAAANAMSVTDIAGLLNISVERARALIAAGRARLAANALAGKNIPPEAARPSAGHSPALTVTEQRDTNA